MESDKVLKKIQQRLGVEEGGRWLCYYFDGRVEVHDFFDMNKKSERVSACNEHGIQQAIRLDHLRAFSVEPVLSYDYRYKEWFAKCQKTGALSKPFQYQIKSEDPANTSDKYGLYNTVLTFHLTDLLQDKEIYSFQDVLKRAFKDVTEERFLFSRDALVKLRKDFPNAIVANPLKSKNFPGFLECLALDLAENAPKWRDSVQQNYHYCPLACLTALWSVTKHEKYGLVLDTSLVFYVLSDRENTESVAHKTVFVTRGFNVKTV